MPRLLARVAVSTTAVAALVVLAAPPASAVFVGPRPGARSGSNTELVLSATGPGHSVNGFIAKTSTPFDPVVDGYPASNPGTGWSAKGESFAGVIYGKPTDGSPTLTLYCIDILTETNIGIGYELGSWNSAAVPNVGYVARLLNSYYPATNEPASLTNAADKAAAVQAAVWFFTDRYVLNTSDPMHNATAAIVSAVRSAGPLTQPPPPSLTITPAVDSGPAGSIVGPFTINAKDSKGASISATVSGTGANMFADAAATQPIAKGASVPDGTKIWLKSTGPKAAVLQATAKATVPSGNVYLYDGNSAQTDAQKLILSQTTELTTTVDAVAEFLPTGSLTVTKTVAGPAAGEQGPIAIVVNCGGVVLAPGLALDAGAPAGSTSHTWTDIPEGSTCTVDEIHDGHTTSVTVKVTGDGDQVTIPSGGTATIHVTDTYDFAPGSLIVKKSIRGEGAGRQGQIRIHTVCDGTALDPDFVIAAGHAAGITEKQYDNIPAGASCTVSESSDGHNSEVRVTVTGGGTVTVPAGDVVEADVTDLYLLNPGSLTVDKTIEGDGAGQQGAITILVSCVSKGVTTNLPPFVIPAGAGAGTRSHTYDNIPGDSVCTVNETADGHTATVAVRKRGAGQEVTIQPGGTATADLTDTYLTGVLVVNKTIDGDAAGHQGQVTIQTVCNDIALTPDLVIPAGSASNTYSQAYSDFLTPATCTVTETADGSSSTITVETTGSGQTVTIPDGGAGTADLNDTYTYVPGSLAVTKTINGASAGDQGEVRIQVDCGEQVETPDFVIPAGATGSQTRTYTGIPANTVCAVAETQDGSSSTVAVTVTGSPDRVTIAPNETATSGITDTYGAAPGALLVTKSISGESAGKQGAITIAVKCGSTSLPTWTIPAGTAAKTLTHAYDGIPAGSSCTVTETSDGATSAVVATVDGARQITTVPAGGVKVASITDSFTPASGAVKAIKTIAGAGAGQQARIGILVLCGGPTNTFAFVIRAHHAGGPVSRVFNGVPGGSKCLVAEAVDGSTTDLAVKAIHARQHVVVTPAGLVSVHMTDRFSAVQLAATGPHAPIAPLIGIALAAILAGAGAILLGRRRQS